MINDQLQRILKSSPDSILTAVEHNNHELQHLQTLLEQRGKQVLSLQTILSSEMGLVETVIRTKHRLGDFAAVFQQISVDLKALKEHVNSEIKRSRTDLISEIAKVFKDLCVDKKAREEEIRLLQEKVEELEQEIRVKEEEEEEIETRTQEVPPLDEEDASSGIRSCELPLLDNIGYTLGSSQLKQLFTPIHQLLDLEKLRTLQQINYEGSTHKGLKCGRGTTYYEHHFLYRGMFKDGVRQGFGELVRRDKVIFRGDWKKDCFWGKGTLNLAEIDNQFQNSCVYMGNFQAGEMEGLGVIEFGDGTRLTSQFHRGALVTPAVLEKDSCLSLVSYCTNSESQSQISCH